MDKPNKKPDGGQSQPAQNQTKKQHAHFNRFPAYGKLLSAMRRAGKVPARIVQVVFDWKLARAYPRIVLADDIAPTDLNFSYLAGLSVQVIYRSKDAHRVQPVVEEILKAKPCFLATFAVDRAGEEGARALIIPLTKMQMRAAA